VTAAFGHAIFGLGACTAVGRTARATAAAVRAGLCGFSEHPFVIDSAGEPMRVARAPWLDGAIDLSSRCGALLVPAIGEALADASSRTGGRPMRIGLAIGLPPARPGRPRDLAEQVMVAVDAAYPGAFAGAVTFESGHAAWFLAVDAALRSGSGCDAHLVASVDSYLCPETLEWIEKSEQLHGGGHSNNAWGFIPGEAAGAVIVAAHAQGGIPTDRAYGRLEGLGVARESQLIKTDDVCTAEGLTGAFRSALSSVAPQDRIGDVYCDLNGEPYRADEYAFAALRIADRCRAVADVVAPADCWGDVGAAGAPLHITLALIAHRKRYCKGPLALVCASSESGERGAAVVRGADRRGD
jgi:3-oxoacyl-[acyl-carrier-protein] synthase I